MSENPTQEFTEVAQWNISHPGGGSEISETCSFVEIEYKYFEGFNIPIKLINGVPEPFDVAYQRVRRYLQLDFETKHQLRNKIIQP